MKNSIFFVGLVIGLLAASFVMVKPVSAECDEDLGPTIATSLPSNLTDTSATLNAFFTSRDACYTDFTRPQVVFEFGETSSLESQSNPIGVMLGATSVSIEITELDPGQSYFYRAVMYYDNSVVKGDKVRFYTHDAVDNSNSGLVVTESNTIINAGSGSTVTSGGSTTSNSNSGSTVTSNSTNSTSTSSRTNNKDSESSNGVAALSITNGQDIIRNGEYVTYEVSYANLASDRELDDAVLLVTLPSGMQYISGSDGVSFSSNQNAAVMKLRDVGPDESGEYTITARVRNVKMDEAIAEAKLTYRDVVIGSRENLTAFDIDEIDISTYGAPLAAGLFASGFLPGNIFGWLLIAVILIAIIYLVRVHFWRYYWHDDRPVRPVTQETNIGEAPRARRV